MSIRLPHSIDRLSSLSSLGDSTPERTSPSHHRQPSDTSETTAGLVQRCVIIQRTSMALASQLVEIALYWCSPCALEAQP